MSLERSILPIPDRRHAGLVTYDARSPDAAMKQRWETGQVEAVSFLPFPTRWHAQVA